MQAFEQDSSIQCSSCAAPYWKGCEGFPKILDDEARGKSGGCIVVLLNCHELAAVRGKVGNKFNTKLGQFLRLRDFLSESNLLKSI